MKGKGSARSPRPGCAPRTSRPEELVDVLAPGLPGSILLGAHPDETWDSVARALAAARAIDAALPRGLDLTFATGGRVYATVPLGRWGERRPRAGASGP
jgi:hypothetical protein